MDINEFVLSEEVRDCLDCGVVATVDSRLTIDGSHIETTIIYVVFGEERYVECGTSRSVKGAMEIHARAKVAAGAIVGRIACKVSDVRESLMSVATPQFKTALRDWDLMDAAGVAHLTF